MQEKLQNSLQADKQCRTPWLEFCALLALAQVLIAGYRYGVANQSIQTTILKNLIDPELFANDPLITTIQHYPSMFFKWLAAILSSPADIQAAYFILHILTTFGLFCGLCLLAKGLSGRWAPGMLALLILAGGHWSGLAESNLYTMEFTHTRAALSLTMLALGLYSTGRLLPAFTLLGLSFCIHPLMACYTSAILGTWLIADLSRDNWKKLILSALPAAVLGLPVIMRILADTQVFGPEWIRLIRIRSPHHVFPSTWWTPGNPEVPRFMLLTGFAVLAASATQFKKEAFLRIKLVTAVILAMLFCGYVFTELIPVPAVMRAQLFRSSRFLVVIAVITVACWGTSEVRDVFTQRRHMFKVFLPALVIITMAVPAFAPLAPCMLLVTALYLLVQGRLKWWASAWTGLVALCCLAAWRNIGFQLIEMPPALSLQGQQVLGLVLIAFAVIMSASYSQWEHRTSRFAVSATSLALFTAVLVRLYPVSHAAGEDDWTRIQQLTRSLTPRDSVVLAPPFPGGFRVYSDRAIVGEWRDGTQQFFDANYTTLWWERMGRLRSGLLYDEEGVRILSRGLDYNRLPDANLEDLLKQYEASYFVSKSKPRDFESLAKAGPWTLYSAKRIVHPPPRPPSGVSDAEIWEQQEEFMKDVVYPNIDKYRKSDAELVLTDANGRPLKGASYKLKQTASRFLFGSALPNFVPPRPPQVAGNRARINDQYLEHFKEIFNFTIIGYAGKWNAIEGEMAKPWFENLDEYVNWCADNGIIIEYHFVSGYQPAWLKPLRSSERKIHLIKHAERLIERYGDKIKYWQIVNERHNLNESPDVFALFREKLPSAALGISNCARFYSEAEGEKRRKSDMVHGWREMQWLMDKDVDLDFFGYHGHRPFGLWADAREIYEGLDYCGEYGVRVHISEFGMHMPHEMIGPVRKGKWTEELQAEYYRRYYTVCFSHPLVDAINLWGMGPSAWIKGGGLLDSNHEPKAAFHTLKKLIHEDWRTNMEGDVSLDGHIPFRGFHGEYEISITEKETGSTFTSKFNVLPGEKNSFRISLNRQDASAEITVSP